MMMVRVLMVVSIIAGLSCTRALSQNSRLMTLEDCIQEAVEHNLDVKISRYSVTFAQLDLDLSYAGWDPVFDIGGQHGFSRRGGGWIRTNGLSLPRRSTANFSPAASTG